MTRELKPFRHLEEPLGSFQLRSIGYRRPEPSL